MFKLIFNWNEDLHHVAFLDWCHVESTKLDITSHSHFSVIFAWVEDHNWNWTQQIQFKQLWTEMIWHSWLYCICVLSDHNVKLMWCAFQLVQHTWLTEEIALKWTDTLLVLHMLWAQKTPHFDHKQKLNLSLLELGIEGQATQCSVAVESSLLKGANADRIKDSMQNLFLLTKTFILAACSIFLFSLIHKAKRN